MIRTLPTREEDLAALARFNAQRARQLQEAVEWLNSEDFDTTQSADDVRERFNAICGYPV